MKNLKIILCSLCILLFLAVCIWMAFAPCKSASLSSQIDIGEYLFSVEEAIGDRYNVRVTYSVKRHDNNNIEPTLRFASLLTDDFSRSGGASVEYKLSNDQKTMWIIEEHSSSQKFSSEATYTVTLNDLTFGENTKLETVKGTWSASYKIRITEKFNELLNRNVTISIPHDQEYKCLISSIQMSKLGIHIEMTVPDSDISNLAGHFTVAIVLRDDTIIELPDLHHSIRSNKWSNDYYASCETIFSTPLALDEVSHLVICGEKIPV